MATSNKNEGTTSSGAKKQANSGGKGRQSGGFRELLKSIAMGFVLFVLLRTFLIQTFTITSGSMEGTLLVGDFLVLSKSAYGATVPGTDLRLPGYTSPKRGDIIVFRGHHEPIDLVKRIIGLPGDTLAMRDGILNLNGVPQTESFVKHTDPDNDTSHPWMMTWQPEFLTGSVDPARYHPTRDNWGPIAVPAGQYFVLGDNRDESLDSRYWGFVPEADIKGKAALLYFSFDKEALGPVPFFDQVRWSRIGDLLH